MWAMSFDKTDGEGGAPDADDPQTNRELEASERSWFISPPHGWIHQVTGRHGWQPDPLLLAFGQYVKRSRYLAQMSQVELARLSGVDQGAISRLERALAPAMKVERIVRLSKAMGRVFPLGYCPHEHWCQWQPAPERPPQPRRHLTPEELHIVFGLEVAKPEDVAEPESHAEEPLIDVRLSDLDIVRGSDVDREGLDPERGDLERVDLEHI